MSATSYVASEKGIPYLYINGERQEGLAYITYLTEKNRYADFAAAGYRLFSVPVFFGYNRLNENSGLAVFTKGIFDGETPDFSTFDADIKRILDACPDAYILPRVNVSPSRGWEVAHPNELCEPYADGTLGRFSFASDLWAEKAEREIAAFLEHIENSEYAARIAGYQIAGGNTEEWLPLDKKGGSGPRAQEKYEAYLRENRCEASEEAFYRFYSELVAERILALCGTVKRITGRSVAVGSFYGYTLECPERTSGHHALSKLLESEDIDFICSPVSYSGTRAVGRDHPYMLPVDSVKLHGKLYFSENDTRTHLSKPVNDTPWYTSPIWFGKDEATTCEVLKMHAARALIKGHAAWWFDMWGGWFAGGAYMELLQKVRTLFSDRPLLPMGSAAEVAVFVDEEAYALSSDATVSRAVCSWTRETLGKMGVPYDLYMASDAEAAIDGYKAVVCLKPVASPKLARVAALAERKGKAYLEITEENAKITTAELRAFLRQANVRIWSEKDAVVYANESYVFLHTAEDGAYAIETPSGKPLKDVFTGEIFLSGTERKKGSSYLLKYI